MCRSSHSQPRSQGRLQSTSNEPGRSSEERSRSGPDDTVDVECTPPDPSERPRGRCQQFPNCRGLCLPHRRPNPNRRGLRLSRPNSSPIGPLSAATWLRSTFEVQNVAKQCRNWTAFCRLSSSEGSGPMAQSSLTSRLLRSSISGVIDENNEELETGPLIRTPVLEISWR